MPPGYLRGASGTKLPYDQAWELVREEWAFLPSEEDQPNLGEDRLEL